MSREPSPATSDIPVFTPKLYGIALLIAAIILAGIGLLAHYLSADLARDMRSWQEKLNLIAESREAEVSQWVGDHFKELRALSSNPSLQLYMTELQSQGAANGEPPQKSYLRNLLLFTAEHGGFSVPHASPDIPADVKTDSNGGLAIIDGHNHVAVSTPLTPGVRDTMLSYASKAKKGVETLIDIHKNEEGAPIIGFLVPVFSIQGEHDADAQIGWIAGVKPVDAALFQLLHYPGATEKTLETILVRHEDGKIDYLSPLQDGTQALGRHVDFNPVAGVAGRLIETPGNFLSDSNDYRGRTVLATSRPVAGTPWILITKIDRQEALAAGTQRRDSTIALFCLTIAVILLIIVALWRYAHSRRALTMSTYFQALAARTMAHEQLLQLVTDNQPEALYIVDASHALHFANQKAADQSGMSPENIAGKTLANMYGAAAAQPIAAQCDRALRLQHTVYDVRLLPRGKTTAVMRSAYVPLAHIPLADLPQPTPGVLVIAQDISDVVHEREQRLDTQRQLIETLVRLVDRRDPFAANHSILVAQVAYTISDEMRLDSTTSETARIAGSLMNIGKIVVPKQLLTKTESLTSQEKRVIHDSMNEAAELLKDIRFEGPVAETLRQWQEKWDGTGPLGLKGEEILVPARIIAVANAFVGMVSPRSWRTALSMDEAVKFLLSQCGSHFDRGVVVALVNYMENHKGKQWLNSMITPQNINAA